MKATIVFANGSKSIAHNLDDTRERWMLRKEIDNRVIAEDSKRGYAVPMIDASMTLDEIAKYRIDLLHILEAINHRISFVYEQKLGKPELFQLRSAKSLIEKQTRLAYDLVYAHTRKEIHREKVERIKANNRSDHDALMAYIERLEQTIIDAKLVLPEPPNNTWMNVAEREEFRRMKADGIIKNAKEYRARRAERAAVE